MPARSRYGTREAHEITQRDRPRASETLETIAEIAERYAKSAAKQIGGRSVSEGDALERIGGLAGLGKIGIGGGRGVPDDIGAFVPGRPTGVTVGGREVIVGNGGDDGGGSSNGGRGRRGGLSRGQIAGLGIAGVGGDDLRALGGELGPGDDVPTEIGDFEADLERPFGGDPLATARAWHRLNPGEAVSDPTREAAGEAVAGPPGQAPQVSGNVPLREAGESLGWVGHVVYPGGAVTAEKGFWAGIVVEKLIRAVVPYKEPPSGPKGPHQRPADDGTGPTGPRSRAARLRPADDGTGPIGPRSNVARPADDGTGPVGPRSHTAGSRTTSFGNRFKPNPEDPRGGGPTS